MSENKNDIKSVGGVLLLLLFILMVVGTIGFYGGSLQERQTRCNITCDMLNSTPIACESGVTVCSNSKVVWRREGQP